MYSGPSLLSEQLPAEMTAGENTAATIPFTPTLGELGLEETVNRFERDIIKSALEKSGGNVLQAAHLLKIPRGTLRYKMEKMEIQFEKD